MAKISARCGKAALSSGNKLTGIQLGSPALKARSAEPQTDSAIHAVVNSYKKIIATAIDELDDADPTVEIPERYEKQSCPHLIKIYSNTPDLVP
jgi:hypothetical protein